jgi:V/A-type H+-transporting ATPase subunit A
MQVLLERGDGIYQMMQVTGEEGITLEDFIDWQKSLLLDMVYLQQDAFDEVDACMPRARQQDSFSLLKRLIDDEYQFQSKDEARSFFTQLTGLYKNWNYSHSDSPEFERYRGEILKLAEHYSKATGGVGQ